MCTPFTKYSTLQTISALQASIVYVKVIISFSWYLWVCIYNYREIHLLKKCSNFFSEYVSIIKAMQSSCIY